MASGSSSKKTSSQGAWLGSEICEGHIEDALNMPQFNFNPPMKLNWGAKFPKPIPEVAQIGAHLDILQDRGLLGRDLLTTMVTRRILPLQRRPHLVCQMSGRHDPCRTSTKRFNPNAVARGVN
ncbi:hypothetical protein D1007_37653 [Hordeum vulgare]|nr:hypothetical protein D1007_37653 [Hordeum vulgare]